MHKPIIKPFSGRYRWSVKSQVSSHLVQAPERGSVVDRSKSSYSSENVDLRRMVSSTTVRRPVQHDRNQKKTGSQVATTTISARYCCADRVLRAEFLIANGSRFSW
jgi:hypothetical protein